MSRRTNKSSQRKSAAHPVEDGASAMTAASAPWNSRDWLYAGLLLVALLVAYYPALHGTPLWDDDAHLTKPELYSWNGLWRIWFDLGATQQYYPLTHSLFWLQHRLWGDNYTGYHLVNVLLHAAAAIFLVCILRELRIPGAWLAGTLWALHPVQVESVAWMSELKNTLSTVCYFSAAWCYLRYERERSWKPWTLAFVLFFLGLMAKSVIATLPAALLLITWWREGRVQWKKDIQPLLPFFAVGIASGLFTAWVERTLIGANGGNFHFSVWERILIAGHAFWFYLFKLLWPAKLTFIYPRWGIDAAQWVQWLYPAFALALVVLLVWKRKQWGRGPFVAVLYFAGTLFPALGFLNIYPFLFSFVADHFQYLACAGPIVLAATGIASLPGLFNNRNPIIEWIPAGLLLAVCFALTWNQSATYRDSETLWRSTLANNTNCWLAPGDLGSAMLRNGQAAQAIAQFQEAIRINPNYAAGHNALGDALLQSGRADDSIAQFQDALRIDPDYAEADVGLGLALSQLHRIDDAINRYQEALRINPSLVEAHNDLGNALLTEGRADAAASEYREALHIRPSFVEAAFNLANLLYKQGNTDDAVALWNKALVVNPNYAAAHGNLSNVLFQQGHIEEAIAHARRALELRPDDATSQGNLAWMLATAPQLALRDGPAALRLATQASRASGGNNPFALRTFAAAQAETGDFSGAARTAAVALQIARDASETALAAALSREFDLYTAGHRYEDAAP